jgi:hypothetical protein
VTNIIGKKSINFIYWPLRWWLTPVILATQEVKIRRIVVRSQPKQIVCKTLSQKLITKKGLVECLKV